jgi:hypothetical protein
VEPPLEPLHSDLSLRVILETTIIRDAHALPHNSQSPCGFFTTLWCYATINLNKHTSSRNLTTWYELDRVNTPYGQIQLRTFALLPILPHRTKIPPLQGWTFVDIPLDIWLPDMAS